MKLSHLIKWIDRNGLAIKYYFDRIVCMEDYIMRSLSHSCCVRLLAPRTFLSLFVPCGRVYFFPNRLILA